MLSETPEIWGAEHLLLRRASSQAVADKLNARLEWWRDYADRHQMELNNNPSPGNLKGGLTTILEKSLGAVAKSGTTPLNDVIGYAEPLKSSGLSFMDSPGYDPCSATGQIASGANLIVFTTGRGSVFGAKPAPSIKVASNAKLASWMDEDMDIDASPVLTGSSLAEVGAVIFQKMIDVASGEPSKSEALGVGDNEFVPWQTTVEIGNAVHRRSLIKLGLIGALASPARSLAQTRARYDVADFGAVGDGRTVNTRSLQAAIDTAAGQGGGDVVVGAGLYLSGALFVKSGVNLMIDRGAVLRGLPDLSAYPMVRTRVAGIEMEWPAGLLNIYQQSGAKITGEGLVDGDGKVFWDSYWALRRDYDPKDLRWAADYDCRRPRLIHVYDSQDVEVSGLNLARSGFWTVHICYSRRVKVSDLVIRNNLGGRGPSTDGIDIDSSEDILVERCDLSVNDDAICIKAGRDWDGLRVARPCRRVTIRDCVVRDALAGMTFGSETSGGFDEIEVSGLRIEYPVPLGVFFKSGHTRGG
ncbi:hypothetical protein LTR94_025652, partial [Friedmanniomyces endolithicus]